MKNGLDLDFTIVVPSGALKSALAALLLAGLSTQLSSETVTMGTFYPAPSGVYTQMMTMGSAILASNGGAPSGSVSIGTTVQPGSGMVVMNNGGAVAVGINTASPGDSLEVAGQAYIGGGCPGATLKNAAGGSSATFDNCSGVEVKSPGALLLQSGPGHAGIAIRGGNVGIGTSTPQMALDVNGNWRVGGSCRTVSYTSDATQCSGGTCSSCNSGEYATWAQGYDTQNQYGTVQNQDGSGQMLCCTCTGGSCPF